MDEAASPDGRQHFIIREPIDVDEATGAVTYLGDSAQGSLLRLARGTRADVLNGVAEAIGTMKQRLDKREVSTLFFFSCVSRRMALGLDTKKEIEMVMAQLGGSSSGNGFYTCGQIRSVEFCPCAQARDKLHSSTIPLLPLSTPTSSGLR